MPRTSFYITASDVIGKIPAADRDAATDDDADGESDQEVMTRLLTDVCDEVDVFYNLRGIATPVDPAVYPLSKQAALYLATEQFYTRRGEPAERNPHAGTVKMMRDLLAKLGDGRLPRGGAISTVSSESDNAVPGDVVAAESDKNMSYPGSGKFLS